jgi:hypothetical protein
MSDSWWVFTPAAGFKAERNCLSRSRFDHQKAVVFYAELCLPGGCGWDTGCIWTLFLI